MPNPPESILSSGSDGGAGDKGLFIVNPGKHPVVG
jgi:hypothetical protein